MSNLFALIQNENMKIYRRPRNWIMMGMLLVIALVVAIIMKTVGDGESSMVEFMNIGKNFTMFVFIFSVVVTAEIVAGEFTWGTIKLLLIRPATRSKILLSKYIAALLYLLLLLVVNYLATAIVGLIFFGNGDAGNLTMLSVLQAYGYTIIDLFMNLTFAFMISSVFRSSVLAIALTFILTFLSGTVMQVLVQLKYSWAKYILFANTDLSQYAAGHKPMLEGMTLPFSLTMLSVYYIVFVALSWTVFSKRDVAG